MQPTSHDAEKQTPFGGDLPNKQHSTADAARGVVSKVKDQHEQTVQRLSSGVKSFTAQAKHSTKEAVRQIRDRGSQAVQNQKDWVGRELSNICEALHSAGNKLDERREGTLAYYTHLLAETVDNAADYVRERPLGSVVGDLRSFARQQPGWIIGGLFVAGLAAGRFLKASERRAVESQGELFGDDAMCGCEDTLATMPRDEAIAPVGLVTPDLPPYGTQPLDVEESTMAVPASTQGLDIDEAAGTTSPQQGTLPLDAGFASLSGENATPAGGPTLGAGLTDDQLDDHRPL